MLAQPLRVLLTRSTKAQDNIDDTVEEEEGRNGKEQNDSESHQEQAHD